MRFASYLLAFCCTAPIATPALAEFRAQAAPTARPITNTDVVDLVKSGLDTDIILTRIRTAPAKDFDTSVAGLKALNDARVPTAIIRFMITGEPPAPPSSAGAIATAPGAPVTPEPFKPGLWVMHQTMAGASVPAGGQSMDQESQVCLGSGFTLSSLGQLMTKDIPPSCSHSSSTSGPSTLIVTMLCAQQSAGQSSNSNMKATIHQTDEEHARTEMTMTMHGFVAGKSLDSQWTSTTDMTYKGDCPAGLQPGDEKKQDGTVIHMH